MSHLTSRVDALNAHQVRRHRRIDPRGPATGPQRTRTFPQRERTTCLSQSTPPRRPQRTPRKHPFRILSSPLPRPPPSRSRPKRSTSGSGRPRAGTTAPRPTPRPPSGSRRSRTATSPNSRRRSATARNWPPSTPIERKHSATGGARQGPAGGDRRDLSGSNEEELAHTPTGSSPGAATSRRPPPTGSRSGPPPLDADYRVGRRGGAEYARFFPQRGRLQPVTTPSRSEGARNGRVPADLPTGSGSDPQGFRWHHRRSARRRLRRGDGGPAGAAAANWVGVAAFDGATNDNVTIHSGGVQSLTASGSIAAGDSLVSAAPARSRPVPLPRRLPSSASLSPPRPTATRSASSSPLIHQHFLPSSP
jgi:hypothetical protein